MKIGSLPLRLPAFSNPQRRRLLIAGFLFAAWMGWLAFLVIKSRDPIVLSRPQFLVSRLNVIAEVQAHNALQVEVQEVHWPTKEQNQLVGKTITVTNLAQCEGWAGGGLYILPLDRDGDHYQVVRIPLSPGFEFGTSKPRIYPKTPQTLIQLEAIHKHE